MEQIFNGIKYPRPFKSKGTINKDVFGYPTLVRYYSGESQTGITLFEHNIINSTSDKVLFQKVISKDLLTPPVSPVIGDRYWIGGTGTDAWLSKDYKIAEWLNKIGDVTFTGTGLDDATSGGTFTGNITTNYRLQIDATGTSDTFSWSDDGGTTWKETGVAITGSAQTLNNGVTITFAAITGHALGDYWDFTATAWKYTSIVSGDSAYVSDMQVFYTYNGSGLEILTSGIIESFSVHNIFNA